MATTAPDVAAATTKTKKSRGGRLAKIMFIVLAFGAGAAAGGFGAVIATGALGFGGGKASNHGEAAATPVAGPIEYVELAEPFTSNLADTGRYLQVKLSVAQSGGPAVTAAIARHKPAIVSAVLGVLGEAGEADVATREAKDRLRLRLKIVINETLVRNAAAGGVNDVFFTSLVVQ